MGHDRSNALAGLVAPVAMSGLQFSQKALMPDFKRLSPAAGLKRLYTVGALAREASRAFGDGASHFEDQAGLVAALREALGPGVRCLVKGSRSSAMDKVVAALADADKDTGGDHHAA